MNLNNIKQAYAEVDVFLNLLPDNERNKIPEKIINKIREEKDIHYEVNINPDIDIEKQNLKRETLAIIAMLNLKYWCDDEEERKRLKKVYEQNQEKVDRLIQVDFDPQRIFSNKKNENEEQNDNKDNLFPTIKKDSIFKRILNKIKVLFKLSK